MDRRGSESPLYLRQWSASSSPAMSPARTHSRHRNTAAQRLAQVMASQTVNNHDDYYNDDDDDDDLVFHSSSYSSNDNSNRNGVGSVPPIFPSRPNNRPPSPLLGPKFVEDNRSVRSKSARSLEVLSMGSTTVVPPSKSTLKTPLSIAPIDPLTNRSRDRFPSDIRQLNPKDAGNQHEASALQDELDMLQEENEIIIDKLRYAERRREETEARARELEKQVASLGGDESQEALGRREAALHEREVAFKAAKQAKDQSDSDLTALRVEIENLKDKAAAAIEQQQEAEAEAKALHTMTHRMILTQEEMEEVVLKRCWLARYWGLAVRHGICTNIALSKHGHWSSLAPLPFEFVTSAGQKAKEESWNNSADDLDRRKPVRDLSDITGEGNIESMLSVEMSLKELASLKVEDAVLLAFARHRCPNFVQQSVSDSTSSDDQKYVEAFELSDEEREDVLFKEAWLIYFWRRALFHGVEEDVAEERLQFWISRSGQSPTSLDAVEVERGLLELRKLGIEQQLWEASRKEIDEPPGLAVANHRLYTDSEASS